MDEEEMMALRKECIVLAVDSGAHFSEAVGAADQFYDFITRGAVPSGKIIQFPPASTS